MVGDLMHGVLHYGHCVMADESAKAQHHTRHAMVATLAREMFELADNRFQDFTGSQQTFSGMRLCAFLLDELQQLLAQLTRRASCQCRQNRGEFFRGLGVDSLMSYVVLRRFGDRGPDGSLQFHGPAAESRRESVHGDGIRPRPKHHAG